MRVVNHVMEIFNGSVKADGGHSYLVTLFNKEEKHVYLVKREGQRSWGGFALTDIDTHMTHIKGNSGNILKNVLDVHRSGADTEVWRIYKISDSGKILLRKAIMEAITYGTVGENSFDITK